MPVILPEATWPTWLGETDGPIDAVTQMLAPYSGYLIIWPVDKAVGSAKNSHAGLAEHVHV